jgi:hypothetical protein
MDPCRCIDLFPRNYQCDAVHHKCVCHLRAKCMPSPHTPFPECLDMNCEGLDIKVKMEMPDGEIKWVSPQVAALYRKIDREGICGLKN